MSRNSQVAREIRSLAFWTITIPHTMGLSMTKPVPWRVGPNVGHFNSAQCLSVMIPSCAAHVAFENVLSALAVQALDVDDDGVTMIMLRIDEL